MTNGVRLARIPDVDDIAEIQVRSWRIAYAEQLPAELLAGLDPPDLALEWARSILQPPTPKHRVLVAFEQLDGAEHIRGYAAFGPSDDPDAEASTSLIMALVVDHGHQRRGHGSRLMAACVDLLRESAFSSASTWLLLGEDERRKFFTSTGWTPDSAFRDRLITPEDSCREVRLVTDISST